MTAVAVFVFIGCWFFMMTYVVLGNILYFGIVLPALNRDGLDGSPKFMPSKQLEQVELFVARHSADSSNSWYFGILSHARALTVIPLVVFAIALCAFLAVGMTT